MSDTHTQRSFWCFSPACTSMQWCLESSVLVFIGSRSLFQQLQVWNARTVWSFRNHGRWLKQIQPKLHGFVTTTFSKLFDNSFGCTLCLIHSWYMKNYFFSKSISLSISRCLHFFRQRLEIFSVATVRALSSSFQGATGMTPGMLRVWGGMVSHRAGCYEMFQKLCNGDCQWGEDRFSS